MGCNMLEPTNVAYEASYFLLAHIMYNYAFILFICYTYMLVMPIRSRQIFKIVYRPDSLIKTRRHTTLIEVTMSDALLQLTVLVFNHPIQGHHSWSSSCLEIGQQSIFDSCDPALLHNNSVDSCLFALMHQRRNAKRIFTRSMLLAK